MDDSYDFDSTTPNDLTKSRVLALSGGGYRGLFTASVLEKLEERYGNELINSFDLIAGTSAGALIAAALSASIPARTIRQVFEENGRLIFPRNYYTSLKQLFVAPYATRALSNVLDRLFVGQPFSLDDSLSEIPLKLLITAVSFDSHRLRVFCGKDLNGESIDKISLRNALLASAAAPTYFPALKVSNGESYVDGGLVANAPDLIALIHAMDQFGLSLDQFHMMSIGTAAPDPAGLRKTGFHNGIFPALFSKRGIVKVTLDSQEAMAVDYAGRLLKNNYFRIDRRPTGSQAEYIRSMDCTDKSAQQTLLGLANEAVTEALLSPKIRMFLS